MLRVLCLCAKSLCLCDAKRSTYILRNKIYCSAKCMRWRLESSTVVSMSGVERGAEWTLGMEFETEGVVVGMNLTWDNKREASGD